MGVANVIRSSPSFVANQMRLKVCLMSNHVMSLALDNIVMMLSIKGRGYLSFLDIVLSFLKSWHKRIPPPGFFVNIIEEAHGAWLASMKPLDKLSVTHCQTHSILLETFCIALEPSLVSYLP